MKSKYLAINYLILLSLFLVIGCAQVPIESAVEEQEFNSTQTSEQEMTEEKETEYVAPTSQEIYEEEDENGVIIERKRIQTSKKNYEDR